MQHDGWGWGVPADAARRGAERVEVAGLRCRLPATSSARSTLRPWCADHRRGNGPILGDRHAGCPELRDEALPVVDCGQWRMPARLHLSAVRARKATAGPFDHVLHTLRAPRRMLFADPLSADPHLPDHRAVVLACEHRAHRIVMLREPDRLSLLTARAASGNGREGAAP